MTAQTPALLAYETLSMTSREVADLTGKRHDNVIRDIEAMLAELPDNVRVEAGIYLDSQGKEQPEFTLNKELTYTLVAGYNTALRHAIVKRWLELETEVAQKALDTSRLQRLPPPERQELREACLREVNDDLKTLTNKRGLKAMIAAIDNATNLGATPAQVAAAALAFHNKHALKFLAMQMARE